MITQYADYAENLRTEADFLLKNKKIFKPFVENGLLHVTGSYALDVLVWRDLDLYFEPNNPKGVYEIFAESLKLLTLDTTVTRIKLEKALYKKYAHVPKGIYLGIKVQFDENHLWKIDIWALDHKKVQNNLLREIASFKDKMTAEKRNLILRTKHALMGERERTPSFSSYFVYKAILEKNMENVDQIKTYIRSQGVFLPK
jgi:hypothetical protein